MAACRVGREAVPSRARLQARSEARIALQTGQGKGATPMPLVVRLLLRSRRSQHGMVCSHTTRAPRPARHLPPPPGAGETACRGASPVSHTSQPPFPNMECRTLSHSLASCSGLARPVRSLQRLAAAPAVTRRAARAAAPRAVAGLSRESLMQQPNLNAPSEEELASPVAAVSNRAPLAAAASCSRPGTTISPAAVGLLHHLCPSASLVAGQPPVCGARQRPGVAARGAARLPGATRATSRGFPPVAVG